MPRIKIDLPSRFSFRTIIPIRITDINYGGHVGNDSLLSLIHESRMRYLQSLGMSEMNFSGKGLIMSDVAIEFKKELFYGQSVIAEIAAGDFGKLNFDIYYKLSIEQKDGANPVAAAFAKTGMICYDYEAKKVAAIPDDALQLLQS